MKTQDRIDVQTKGGANSSSNSAIDGRIDLNQIARSRFFVNLAMIFFGFVILPLVIIGNGNPITDAIAIVLALPTISALYYWGVALAAAMNQRSSKKDWILGLPFCVPVLGIIPLTLCSIEAARILKRGGAKPGLFSPRSFTLE